jgi:hypothetical protein
VIRTRAAVALVALAPILLIDFGFVVAFAQSDILSQATTLGLIVFFLQFGKTAVILGLNRLRTASMALLVDIYGAELLSIPFLLSAFLLFPLSILPQAVNEIVGGWIAGVSVAGLIYVAVRLGIGIFRSESLTTVIPLGLVATELGVVLTDGVLAASKAHTGLGGVAASAYLQRGNAPQNSPLVFVAVAFVYLSLLLYAVIGWDVNQIFRRNTALSLAAAATIASAAIVYSVSFVLLPIDLVLIPPTLAAIGSGWWIGRGK